MKQKKESQPQPQLQHEKTRHKRMRPKLLRETENNPMRKTPFYQDGKITPDHSSLKKIELRTLTKMSESIYSSNRDTLDTDSTFNQPYGS